jgi:hypothetical protein
MTGAKIKDSVDNALKPLLQKYDIAPLLPLTGPLAGVQSLAWHLTLAGSWLFM